MKKPNVNVNDNVNENENVNVLDSSIACEDDRKIIDEYQREIGTMTPFQLSKLEDYLKDIPSEMVVEAIHIASKNNKKSLSYIEAILKRWIKQGYKCVADLERDYKKKKEDTSSDYLKENGIESLDYLYEN